jgi:hypothetical protein
MSRSFARRVLNRLWPVLLAPFLSVIASVATAQTCSGPGTERWPIKVSVVGGVNLQNPKTVGLNALLTLEDPTGVKHNDPRYQDARIPAFSNSLNVQEGDILQTTGWLYLVATETDCDYHIQISNQPRTTTDKPTPQDNCVVVEAPKPDFVDNTQLKQNLTTLRDFIKSTILKGKEPSTTASVMVHPVCVRVTGQLFYDDALFGNSIRSPTSRLCRPLRASSRDGKIAKQLSRRGCSNKVGRPTLWEFKTTADDSNAESQAARVENRKVQRDWKYEKENLVWNHGTRSPRGRSRCQVVAR